MSTQISRRRFLQYGAVGGAALYLPWMARPAAAEMDSKRDFFTADENARRQLRQLDAPLVLGDDAQVIDTDLVVGPNFAPSDVTAAVYWPGKRVVWRNSRLLTNFQTWDSAWAADPRLYAWVGLRIAGAVSPVIDGLHVEGFPYCGVQAYGVNDAHFARVSGTRCFWILEFGNAGGGSHAVVVNGLRAWDTWGPGPDRLPGVGGSPSRLRAGGWSGAGGLAGQLRDATLRDLDISGELGGGLKLTRSQRVNILGAKTNRLMIQGTEGRNANTDGSTEGSSSIVIRGLLVDKRRGVGDVSKSANAVQISWNVRGLDMADYLLLSGGMNGHGIQLSGDCKAIFREGVIAGFNGVRGTEPAYALEIEDGSSVNADFETANRFYDQERIVRTAA